MKINSVKNIFKTNNTFPQNYKVLTIPAIGLLCKSIKTDKFESNIEVKQNGNCRSIFDKQTGRKISDTIFSSKTGNPVLQYDYDADEKLIEIINYDENIKNKIIDEDLYLKDERIQNRFFASKEN